MATVPISDTQTRNDYTATASQTTFPYTFWVKDEDHLDVYVNSVLKTITSDYTVSAVQSVTGANVVFNSGLSASDAVAIVLNPDVERQTEFQTSGSLTASAINLELTYLVSLMQWIKTQFSRKFGLSDSATGVSDLTLTPAASTVLGWNSAGTGVQNYSFASVSSSIDTSFTSLSDNDFLQYNSSTQLWENTAAPAASVADNSITLAKMAHGTDGNLITYDAAGAPAYVSTGTSGQILTSNGAGAAPTFQTPASVTPQGVVLQYETTVSTTTVSTTSGTFADTTISATLGNDLASSSNKVKITVSGVGGFTDHSAVMGITLFRDSTELTPATTEGMTAVSTGAAAGSSSVIDGMAMPWSFTYIDTPGSTTPAEYSIYINRQLGSATAWLGRSGDNARQLPTIITVEELSA